MDRFFEIIKDRLSDRRFKHTLGVVAVAEQLAGTNGVAQDKARLAAMFHDYARELEPERLKSLAVEMGIEDETVLAQPELLHAPVGAMLVKQNLGIDDPEILAAIVSHTVGGRKMSKLAQIIYLADMIEPNRSYPGVEDLRAATRASLKQGLLAAFEHTIRYLLDNNKPIDVNTIEARNYFIMGGD